MLPIIVLYDREDASRFLAERPAVRAICALTPNAEDMVKGEGLPVSGGRKDYGDWSQARTLAARERALREWHDALPRERTPDSTVWFVLEMALSTLLHGYDRIRRVIGNEGPWLIPAPEGWTLHERRDRASLAMSRHVLRHYWHFVGNIVSKPPPLAPLYRLLRAAAVLLGRGRHPSWACCRSDHPLRLERVFMASHPTARQWYLYATNQGWREYLKIGRELWRILRGGAYLQIGAIPREPHRYERQAMAAVDALPDPEMKALMLEFWPRIGELCGIAGGARADFADVVRSLKPDFMLASETADCVAAALFDACGDVGIERRVASHNTFAPVTSPINLVALRHQICHQYGFGAAEQMLFWHPPFLAAAQQAMPKAAAKCLPIAAVPVDLPTRTTGAAFHVLHATNCMRYFSRPSWIFEDCYEFVDGAIALVRAGLKVEGTTYMIRTKSRDREIDEELLRGRLEKTGRVEIAFRHTRPFKEDLARADLLVAFHSTTIEQALHARKPVLLWGITPRFRELPGRTTPPRPGDRAAVYSVDCEADLADMIAGIRDAHRGRPLTDDEIAPYVHPPGTMTPEMWARQWSARPSA